tara:strand:- start:1036 stop:1434 length:399 start_codon:yes stop_codon:yes gene_type:complete
LGCPQHKKDGKWLFQKPPLFGGVMVEVEVISILVQIFCGTSAILFMFVATFSRSERAELLVQNIIFSTLILAAASLWWLSLAGGSLWGSNYLPRPLSIVCIILAIAARMNIKGENVSFGANPHSIGRNPEEE